MYSAFSITAAAVAIGSNGTLAGPKVQTRVCKTTVCALQPFGTYTTGQIETKR